MRGGAEDFMTDYRKWDKMAAMLDDDGSDDEAAAPGRQQRGFSSSKQGPVRVTRMDQASTVTIGQDGDLVIGGPASSEIGAASTAGTQGLTAAGALKTDGTCTRKQGAGVDYSKWNSFGDSDSDEDHQDEMESDDDGAQCDEPLRGGTASQDEAVLSAHGAAPPVGMPKDKLHDPTRNGGVCDCYFWSQDRKEVCINVLVPAGTRAKQLQVAVDSGRLEVRVDTSLVLHRSFAYPVRATSRPEDLDWEVTQDSNGRRVVRVTVEKTLPGDDALPCLPRSEAMIVWWKRVFEGDPEIDVSAIPDRKANHQALEKHKQAWKEAHDMFREKIKSMEPVPL